MTQVEHGSRNGAVTDASQTVVPGAKVTGLRRETTTGNAETYQLATLPIGVYTVVVSKAGFHAAGEDMNRTSAEVGRLTFS
jgi:hypothetical protein